MKLNPKFLTHETRGEHYIIPTSNAGFNGIVKNNETAAFIVECLKTDTTTEQIADKLLAEYHDADRTTVLHDVMNIVNKLRSIGAIDDE